MVTKTFQGWTRLRCKYGNNLKGERALEDEKQNIKGENSFLVRKKEIHKLKSSAYILWDFLRRGEEKSNQSWQHEKAVVLSTITSSPFNLFGQFSLTGVS